LSLQARNTCATLWDVVDAFKWGKPEIDKQEWNFVFNMLDSRIKDLNKSDHSTGVLPAPLNVVERERLFKYLDTSEDGTIQKREFEALFNIVCDENLDIQFSPNVYVGAEPEKYSAMLRKGYEKALRDNRGQIDTQVLTSLDKINSERLEHNKGLDHANEVLEKLNRAVEKAKDDKARRMEVGGGLCGCFGTGPPQYKEPATEMVDTKKEKEKPDWVRKSEYKGHRVFESILRKKIQAEEKAGEEPKTNGAKMSESKKGLEYFGVDPSKHVYKKWRSTSNSLYESEKQTKLVNDQFQKFINQQLEIDELEAQRDYYKGISCKIFGFMCCC